MTVSAFLSSIIPRFERRGFAGCCFVLLHRRVSNFDNSTENSIWVEFLWIQQTISNDRRGSSFRQHGCCDEVTQGEGGKKNPLETVELEALEQERKSKQPISKHN